MTGGNDSDSFHSYPSVYALGHRGITNLLLDPVLVEEKIDGSQISWCLDYFGQDEVELRVKSKGAQLNLVAPEKMFIRAIDVIQELQPLLHIGWTYRAEYLARPKHNALAYDRIPEKHLIIFDINTGNEEYLSYGMKLMEASRRLGLEVVPRIYEGVITDPQMIRSMLDRTSILGGQKIEGVVIKNYSRFNPQDKKVLMGKFVSEAFKEVHDAAWKKANPHSGDILQSIIDSLRTPARWGKAVQHLRDAGMLESSPRDIGELIKEVHADIDKECLGLIEDKLMAWATPKVKRGVAAGVAEWYKDELLKLQFESNSEEDINQ